MPEYYSKNQDDIHLSYSFLVNKLDKLSTENSLYKKAFSQIDDVAQKVAAGDISARIIHWDEFDKLSPTLSAINNAYDLIHNLISGMKEVHIIALKNQDDFRKKQIQELKTEVIDNIIPILK